MEDQDQDQDSLLVKRRNDNHSPGQMRSEKMRRYEVKRSKCM